MKFGASSPILRLIFSPNKKTPLLRGFLVDLMVFLTNDQYPEPTGSVQQEQLFVSIDMFISPNILKHFVTSYQVLRVVKLLAQFILCYLAEVI